MENDLKKISLREIIMNTSWKPSEINNIPRFYYKDEVDELLEQFERPVVPQFVADWFEGNEPRLEAELYSTAVSTNLDILDPLPFEEWFLNNENKPHETLIKMKLFGYEVEEKKRWIAKANDNLLFVKWNGPQPIFVMDEIGSLYKAQFFDNKADAENVAEIIGGYVEEVEE